MQNFHTNLFNRCVKIKTILCHVLKLVEFKKINVNCVHTFYDRLQYGQFRVRAEKMLLARELLAGA